MLSEQQKARLYGWWYVSIGIGFILLGIQRILVGGKPWLIVLRWVIAAGFLALGWLQLRRRPP
jgi:hypothetical protein